MCSEYPNAPAFEGLPDTRLNVPQDFEVYTEHPLMPASQWISRPLNQDGGGCEQATFPL